MLNRRYTVALKGLVTATNRLAAAEEKINALRLEQMRRDLSAPNQTTPPPAGAVPPKIPTKK
jgi:hypothetical protein